MLTLRLDEIPSEGLSLEWKEEPVALSGYLENLSDIDFRFEGPLESQATIKKLGQSVMIKGRIKAILQLRCVRCLKEFSYPLASVFELTLRSTEETALTEEVELSDKDLESNFFDGEEIALSEVACEQVFLEIPMKPLCQDGCKGLCPSCGKDMNVSSCECKKKELESEFSVLKKLKLH
jgi:uncharacterized protein